MTIRTGDRLPSANLAILGENGPEKITTDEIFKNKKVVLFALPGAFTPTCSAAHLPGYLVFYDEIKAKGVDTLIEAVPKSLQADPGLAFERMQWRARKGRTEEAVALMLAAKHDTLGEPSRWAASALIWRGR